MSEFLNEENNDKNIENEEISIPETDENKTPDELTSQEKTVEEIPPYETVKSDVDYYLEPENTEEQSPKPAEYTYSPSAQPVQDTVVPQQAPTYQPNQYTFNGGYVPPNQNIYPPAGNRPPYTPPYQQYPNGGVNGSYNYQHSDQAYQNAIKKSGRKSSRVLIAIAVIVAVLGVGGILTVGVMGLIDYSNAGASSNVSSKDNGSKDNNSGGSTASSVIKPAELPEGALTIPQIIKKLKPSVVAVEAAQVGSGTGIIMTKDGYILTNAHVVNGAKTLEVITSDGKKHEAKLRGLDSISDIAVLKMEGSDFTPAEFGKSSDAQEGETVVAMGNPYGLDLANTTTAGIISAIRNNITLGDVKMDLLQTDASINPGNSGGPLINQYGLVIGVTSLKIMSSSGTTSEGLGFAIPIDTAKPIVDEIVAKGYLSGRPMVGIIGQYLSADYASGLGLPAGILVQSTTPGTDAAKKLQKFDMITKINGKAFSSMEEFNAEKNNYKSGESITLTVVRDGKEFTAKLTLSENKGE